MEKEKRQNANRLERHTTGAASIFMRAPLSIVCPSRGRPKKLARLLRSIKAHSDGEVDVFIGLDNCDPFLDEYRSITAPFSRVLDISIREPLLQKYYNRMAARGSSKVIWVMGDDCEIVTSGFDTILCDAAKNLPIAYLESNDSTYNFANNGAYSCFPAITRGAFMALGHFFNCEYRIASDRWLKESFVRSGCPIIDLTTKIMVKHEHLLDDKTHTELQQQLEQREGRHEFDKWIKAVDVDAEKLMKVKYACP